MQLEQEEKRVCVILDDVGSALRKSPYEHYVIIKQG